MLNAGKRSSSPVVAIRFAEKRERGRVVAIALAGKELTQAPCRDPEPFPSLSAALSLGCAVAKR
jgi:hypothetical protein